MAQTWRIVRGLSAAAALAIAAVSVSATPVSQLPQQEAAPVAILLGHYDRGDQAAFELAATTFDVARHTSDFKRVAETWLRGAGDGALSRRRAVLAGATLEMIRLHAEDWDELRGLLEWACKIQRAERPSANERWWHHAVAAFVQTTSDYRFLGHRPPRTRPDDWVEHLDHAQARFADDPILELSQAITAELPTWWSPGEVRNPKYAEPENLRRRIKSEYDLRIGLDVRMDRDLAVMWARFNEQRRWPNRAELEKNLELWNLVDRWTPLASRPEIAAEARLRLGFTYDRLARPDLALPEYRRAEELAAGEPYVTFLARYLGGVLLERQGHEAEAERAYSAALEVVPRAGSASFRIASLWYLRDRQADAVALIGDAVRMPVAMDPWHHYSGSNPARWDTAIQEFRRGLR